MDVRVAHPHPGPATAGLHQLDPPGARGRALRDLIGARVWALLEEMSGLVHTEVPEALGDTEFEAAFAEGREADPRTAATTVRALLGA